MPNLQKLRHFRWLLPSFLLAILLTGCSLIPKKVEVGQDKVEKFPEHTDKFIELQRQVAALAAARAQDTVDAALAEGSSEAVVRPGSETRDLTGAVSSSVGPPRAPFKGTAREARDGLNRETARHDGRIRDFAEDNDENAGKKIEGTGWLQVPYFLWLGIVFAVVVGLYIAAKVALGIVSAMNPPVGVGLQVAQIGAKGLGRAFSEVLRGGESFKRRVVSEVDDPAVVEKILKIFRSEQEKRQSEDTQAIIRDLTRKP